MRPTETKKPNTPPNQPPEINTPPQSGTWAPCKQEINNCLVPPIGTLCTPLLGGPLLLFARVCCRVFLLPTPAMFVFFCWNVRGGPRFVNKLRADPYLGVFLVLIPCHVSATPASSHMECFSDLPTTCTPPPLDPKVTSGRFHT